MTEKTSKNELNEAQKGAAQAGRGPLLIVAGAGTGKTKTLVNRILYLIDRGVPPEKICAITFTNKAAKEMLQRVNEQLSNSAIWQDPKELPNYPITQLRSAKPYIGTFHSLGARILRRECRSFGREPNFTIFDDHDSFDLVKKAVKGFFPKQTTKTARKNEAPAFFAQKIAEIKNLGAPILSSRDGKEQEELIYAVYNAYEEGLARNNAFDFDDLIEKPVRLFSKDQRVQKKYQAQFDAILVDEWQDINPKQYELVKHLAGGHRNLGVVGDDEQTIYSWRYADVRTFLNFEKDWPGATVHFLEENYRSTSNIINAAAAVVANNHFRVPKKLWTANPAGESITLFEAWGENDEAMWIAREIERIQNPESRIQVAILYRTNAQSRAIEQALIRHDIPYRIFGGLKFYERREVRDAVAALRWVANPQDEPSKERLEKGLTKKKFSIFKNRIATVKSFKPSDILTIFLESFGYFEYLEANFINAEERKENIAELVSFVAEFTNLDELLERLSLLQSTDDETAKTALTMTNNNNDDKEGYSHSDGHISPRNRTPLVQLSTIHMAKGLEFDVVFIAGAAEGLLPHIRSIDNDDSLEEERRLMYVAMTRAKKKLFISFYGLASRFISEIPEGYIELSKPNHEDNNDHDRDDDYEANEF